MPKFFNVSPIQDDTLEKIGFSWNRLGDGDYLLRDKLLIVSKAEAEAYYVAANTLYEMYEKAAEYVIQNSLFYELDIPKNLIEPIIHSFNHDRGNHLYGRFDFSGGIDSQPIKLIEFNADTATLLIESCMMQLMMLKDNGLENAEQFNNIYESIDEKFKSIAKTKKGAFSKFLFSCVKGNEEEQMTVKLLQSIANDAGFITNFSYLEDSSYDNDYDFWFKLYPWEEMREYEHQTKIAMLNPAYVLLFQSKGILKILYDLFPESPYLLKCSYEPLKCKYVKKRMFGREGANVEIADENGKILNFSQGEYEEYSAVYQEYVEFVKDKQDNHYQAGVFYASGACGLGFRRGGEILDNMSQFVGHVVM